MRSLIPEALLPLFSDTDFEDLANLAKAWASRHDATFTLVPATEIPFWYHEDQYDSERPSGSLYSCMRYDHCQPWIEMYASLGDSLNLLILRNDHSEKLIGRALVWNAPDGNVYMDRAYGTDATRTRFAIYAREQGWWKRAQDSYDCPREFVDPKGNHHNVTITIPIDTFPEDGFPFVDTLHYLNAKTHTLSNYARGAHADLQNTQGSFSPRDPFYEASVDHDGDRHETLRRIWDNTPYHPDLPIPSTFEYATSSTTTIPYTLTYQPPIFTTTTEESDGPF
jgi:hypothetical protein